MTYDLDDPRSIAAAWHGGQNSALYAYASTGLVTGDSIFREIDYCLTLATTKKDEAELQTLRAFVVDARRDAILRDTDRLVRNVIGIHGDIWDFMNLKTAILETISKHENVE